MTFIINKDSLTLGLKRIRRSHFLVQLLMGLILSTGAKAQEDWVDLVMERSGQTVALSMDLSLFETRPNFKHFVMIGTEFSPCMPNGFPTDEALDHLYAFSDSTSVVLDRITRSRLVGIMTYDCKGFDLYYAKDTLGLRKALDQTIRKNFPEFKYQVFFKKDRNWSDYYKKLYPQDLSYDHLMNQARLHEMMLLGDDLEDKRDVRHWLMFKSLKDRNRISNHLKRLDFKLDSIKYHRDYDYPFELQISREDYIKPDSLANVTLILKLLSESNNGFYDGWETPTRKKDK